MFENDLPEVGATNPHWLFGAPDELKAPSGPPDYGHLEPVTTQVVDEHGGTGREILQTLALRRSGDRCAHEKDVGKAGVSERVAGNAYPIRTPRRGVTHRDTGGRFTFESLRAANRPLHRGREDILATGNNVSQPESDGITDSPEVVACHAFGRYFSELLGCFSEYVLTRCVDADKR